MVNDSVGSPVHIHTAGPLQISASFLLKNQSTWKFEFEPRTACCFVDWVTILLANTPFHCIEASVQSYNQRSWKIYLHRCWDSNLEPLITYLHENDSWYSQNYVSFFEGFLPLNRVMKHVHMAAMVFLTHTCTHAAAAAILDYVMRW